MNYSVIAFNHFINSEKLPSKIENPIPPASELQTQFKVPANLTILRRCTVFISDPAHNYRLSTLATAYDILALRPTTEKAFLAACLTLGDHSLISLDLSVRWPFHFKPKPLMTAVKRGIRIEICYAQAIHGDSNGRRNLISNVLAIIRATSGRGLVVSSEARTVLGIRAPADVLNLLQVWGIGGERATEAISVNPRAVVVNESIKRTGYRGIIDIVEGGDPPEANSKKSHQNDIQIRGKGQKTDGSEETIRNSKRKSDNTDNESAPPLSKRQAKRLRLEALKAKTNDASSSDAELSAKINVQISPGK